MRNLSQYPLKHDEALGILEKEKERIQDIGSLGDMRPYALSQISAFLKDHSEEFKAFLEKK